MLPIKAGTHNIKAIIFEWTLNIKNNETKSIERKDKVPTVLNIGERRLFKHLEIKAVIVPEQAEIKAIKDNTKAAWLTSILQKSSKNFFPITLCKT